MTYFLEEASVMSGIGSGVPPARGDGDGAKQVDAAAEVPRPRLAARTGRPHASGAQSPGSAANPKPPRAGRAMRGEKRAGVEATDTREAQERRRLSARGRQELVVAFGFAKSSAPRSEVAQLVKKLEALYPGQIHDEQATITITAGTSRPGSDEANMRLSVRRGNWLKSQLRARGITARIEVDARGEGEARADSRTPMALDGGPAADPLERRDDADYRVAVVTVTGRTTDAEFEPLETPAGGDSLKADITAGRKHFDSIVDSFARNITAQFPVPANPFGEDPSADPATFAKQVGEHVVEGVTPFLKKDTMDTVKGLGKLAGKMTLGMYFEVARNQMREQAAQLRRPYYWAVVQGIGCGIDPTYDPGPQSNQELQRFFDQGKAAAVGLSADEKLQFQIYVYDRNRQMRLASESTYDNLTSEPDGRRLAEQAMNVIERDRRYLRE
jgi:outer membrane protein OmpA-like peptidoglycan-associated protein